MNSENSSQEAIGQRQAETILGRLLKAQGIKLVGFCDSKGSRITRRSVERLISLNSKVKTKRWQKTYCLETSAGQTLVSLIRKHGEGHCQQLLETMVSTNNGHALIKPILEAVSDILLAEEYSHRPGEIMDALDELDLRWSYEDSRSKPGIIGKDGNKPDKRSALRHKLDVYLRGVLK